MKIILSRKGFDSTLGGVASPIFPDGSLLSLPIPDPSGSASTAELRPRGIDLAHVVHDLTRGRMTGATRVHLDPDLERSSIPRLEGWRGSFGQCSKAQRHLERNGVAVKDLFLFFGWFRRVEQVRGRYRYVRGAPDLHVLFGWLEVGEVLTGDALRTAPAWLASHPHVARTDWPSNCIYVAEASAVHARQGAGTFGRYSPALQLTAPDAGSRSVWGLPGWFWPGHGRPPLSHHSSPGRWTLDDAGVRLSTVGRGQEFVLDVTCYAQALPWAVSLLSEAG